MDAAYSLPVSNFAAPSLVPVVILAKLKWSRRSAPCTTNGRLVCKLMSVDLSRAALFARQASSAAASYMYLATHQRSSAEQSSLVGNRSDRHELTCITPSSARYHCCGRAKLWCTVALTLSVLPSRPASQPMLSDSYMKIWLAFCKDLLHELDHNSNSFWTGTNLD